MFVDKFTPQLINFISIMAILGYYFWEKNRFKKEGSSVINKLIEREYKRWYKMNSEAIKSNKITVFELNELLIDLKKSLEAKGIRKQHIAYYVHYLEGKKVNSSWIKNSIIAIVGFFGVKEWINNYISNAILENNFLKNISDFLKFILNQESIKILFAIIEFIVSLFMLALLIYTVYATFKMESINLNNLRISLLKELLNIWDFKVTKVDNLKPEDKEKMKKVTNEIFYVTHETESSPGEAVLKRIFGDSFLLSIKRLNEKLVKLYACIHWFICSAITLLLGCVFPIVFGYLSRMLIKSGQLVCDSNQYWFGSFVVVFGFMIYLIFLKLINSWFIGNITLSKERTFIKLGRYNFIRYNLFNYCQLVIYSIVQYLVLQMSESLIFNNIIAYFIIPLIFTLVLFEDKNN